jgi:flagellar export protein FliJ
MKSLPTLMRVKQRELDALKRQQATLEKRRDDLLNAVDQLTDQLVQELKAAEGLPDMAHFFGGFSASIKKRQETMHAQIRKLEGEIDKLAQLIMVAFSELKKLDLAYAAWKKREAEKLRLREQQEMDEIGIRGYVRKDAV